MKKLIVAFAVATLCISGTFMVKNESKCDGEAFDGESREDAKLSIGSQHAEEMSVNTFLETFTGHPALDEESPRSAIEQKNVTVTAWLYTYAREGDEDFHLVLGSSDQKEGRVFMSAEISGLPKNSSSEFYQRLKHAREEFTAVVLKGEHYCSGFTKKLLKHPLKVIVTGSVFFDTHHASGGSGTGEYKSKSPWEIHPITSIRPAEE